MKADIHPEYNFVVFRDITVDFEILTRSCIDVSSAKETTTIDGTEYPVFTFDISSASHPFYTGKQKLMDTEGRVEAYYRKYGFKNPTPPEDDEGEATAEAEAPAETDTAE